MVTNGQAKAKEYKYWGVMVHREMAEEFDSHQNYQPRINPVIAMQNYWRYAKLCCLPKPRSTQRP